MPVKAFAAKSPKAALEPFEYEAGPLAPDENAAMAPARGEISLVESLPDAPPATCAAPASLAGLPLYRLSIEQYRRMGDQGIIDEKSRTVLIHGLLVTPLGKNPPHSFACDSLSYLLVRSLPDGWFVSNQGTLLLPLAGSQPEPDLKVVRGRLRDFEDRHVLADDVAIVVEISDSSVRADQTVMKILYATSAIPEYWIVNLVARRIEVYTDPTGPDPSPDYRRRQDYNPGQAVPLRIEGADVVQILVDDVLPIRPGG